MLQLYPRFKFQSDKNKPTTRTPRPQPSHFEFRKKYLIYFMAGISGSMLAFLLPAIGLVANNYQLFKSVALTIRPDVYSILERESLWLIGFLIVAGSLTLITIAVVVSRLLSNILSPIEKIEGHLSKICDGQWEDPEFNQDSDADLYDFLDLYSYTYRTVRARTEAELKILERLSIDPRDKEAYALWSQLINTKKQQLRILNLKSENDLMSGQQNDASRTARLAS